MTPLPYVAWILVLLVACKACFVPATLPNPRANSAIALLNDNLFFAGGVGAGNQISGALDIYDTRSNTWRSTRLDTPRNLISGTTVGDYILFAGGVTSSYSFYRALDIYDVNLNLIQRMELPTALAEVNYDLKVLATPTKACYFAQERSNFLWIVDPLLGTSKSWNATGGNIVTVTTNSTHLFLVLGNTDDITVLNIETLEVTKHRIAMNPRPVAVFHLRNYLIFIGQSNVIYTVSTIDFRPSILFGDAHLRARTFAVTDSQLFVIESGQMAVITVAHQPILTKYALQREAMSYNTGSVVHNGIIYLTGQTYSVVTIDIGALFTRLEHSRQSLSGAVIAKDTLFWLDSIVPQITWYNLNERVWKNTPWPSSRYTELSVVVNGLLVVAGSGSRSNACDIFNFSAQTWTFQTMPYSFRPYTAIAHRDLALFNDPRTVYIFNTTSQEWRTLPLQNYSETIWAVNNKIFTRQIEVIDITTGHSTVIAFNKTLGSRGRPRTTDTHFFATGYSDDSVDVFTYDTRTNTYDIHRLTEVDPSYAILNDVAVNSKMYLFAGRSIRNQIRVEVYNIRDNTWQGIDMPPHFQIDQISIAATEHYAFVARTRRIDRINLSTFQITELALPVDEVNEIRSYGSKMFFISSQSIVIYESTSGDWLKTSFSDRPRFTIDETYLINLMSANLYFKPIATMLNSLPDQVQLFYNQSTHLDIGLAGRDLTVRWKRDEQPLDETGARLAISNVDAKASGQYSVNVADRCNFMMHQSARITVHGPPSFSQPLEDSVVLCYDTALIGTQVDGVNVSYEWTVNDVDQHVPSPNLLIAPDTLECNRLHILCLAAHNPSGSVRMCSQVKAIAHDQLFDGPRPVSVEPIWFTGSEAVLTVTLLDDDCDGHTWLVNNNIGTRPFATQSSTFSVLLNTSMANTEFRVLATCGNSAVRSRPFTFRQVSVFPVWGVVLLVIGIATIMAGVILAALLLRRRLRANELNEIELQKLLTQAKSDTLKKDGVTVIPSTTWEWTPGDDFTYRPVDGCPCSIDYSMLETLKRADPIKIDMWMQNEVTFTIDSKSSSKVKSTLKERLLEGIQVHIYAPQSPKYEITVEPASFVVQRGKPVNVTISSLMRMTAKCKVCLIIVFEQQKIYSAIDFKLSSAMSTWIDLEEIEMTGEHLGGGGFGSVSRGVYRGQDVAVKRLLSQYLTDDMKIEFEREIMLMKDLRHPNIVTFVGASNVKENLAIVIEYAPMGSLSSVMQKTKLSHSMKIVILLEIAKALQFLHANRIIHRDIKPQNILVFSLEQKTPVHIKLTDFGTSRFISEDKMTVTKNIGTTSYMAPESLGRSPKIDKSADVYSFAILMWEVMFERQPFSEFEWQSDIEIHVKSGKRLPLESVEPVHSEIIRLIDECWRHVPEDRPTMNTVVQQLTSLLP